MAFNLRLTDALRKARWKVKIRNKETREPPHATIIRGTDAWRINLRTGKFMDSIPDPSAVPRSLLSLIKAKQTWKQLCDKWDEMYPNNPVSGDNEE